MHRFCALCGRLKSPHIVYALLPVNVFSTGDVPKETETAKKVDIGAVKETGWERLKRTFTPDEFGQLSPEFNTILQVGCMSMFVGALYGGVLHSRVAFMDFMKSNQATVFRNHFEAKKKLQDQVTVGFGKGAFKWAWRLTFFCTTYMSVATVVAVYRNKDGILEHLIAGATAGFLYKFQMGPRGWLVGSGLGLVLGAVGGSCTLGLLKLTGMSMQEARYWQYKWRQSRDDYFKKEVTKHMEKEQNTLLAERDKNLKTTKSLDDLPAADGK